MYSSISFDHKGKCPISCFLPNGFLHADSALRSLLDPNHLFLWTEGIFLNFSPNPLLHSLMHLNHHLTKSRKLIIYLLSYNLIVPSCPCTFSFEEVNCLKSIILAILSFSSLKLVFLFLIPFLFWIKTCFTTLFPNHHQWLKIPSFCSLCPFFLAVFKEFSVFISLLCSPPQLPHHFHLANKTIVL